MFLKLKIEYSAIFNFQFQFSKDVFRKIEWKIQFYIYQTYAIHWLHITLTQYIIWFKLHRFSPLLTSCLQLWKHIHVTVTYSSRPISASSGILKKSLVRLGIDVFCVVCEKQGHLRVLCKIQPKEINSKQKHCFALHIKKSETEMIIDT